MQALSRNENARERANEYRNYAKNEKAEFFTVINKDKEGNLNFSSMDQTSNDEDHAVGKTFPNTVYVVHSHPGDSSSVYAGPSVGDISGLLGLNDFYHKQNLKNIEGSIIFSSDGSEYLISINNRDLAVLSYDSNKILFQSANGLFQDQSMSSFYNSIKSILENEGYSKDDAHDYALVYMLDRYETGLKISKKENNSNSFREMNNDRKYDNNLHKIVYKPQICKD